MAGDDLAKLGQRHLPRRLVRADRELDCRETLRVGAWRQAGNPGACDEAEPEGASPDNLRGAPEVRGLLENLLEPAVRTGLGEIVDAAPFGAHFTPRR